MARYQIWDKVSPIYTPIGEKLSATEWLNRYQWAKDPEAKMIIGGGRINGSLVQEFDSFVEMYENQGFIRDPSWTDQLVLDQIESWDKLQRELQEAKALEEKIRTSIELTPAERIAAALEYQVMESQEAVTSISPMKARMVLTSNPPQVIKSKAFDRVKKNYDRGLWTEAMVQVALDKNYIQFEEFNEIINGSEVDG